MQWNRYYSSLKKPIKGKGGQPERLFWKLELSKKFFCFLIVSNNLNFQKLFSFSQNGWIGKDSCYQQHWSNKKGLSRRLGYPWEMGELLVSNGRGFCCQRPLWLHWMDTFLRQV